MKIEEEEMLRKLLKEDKMSESLLIGMLLALVGGYLDIYSYVARGRVFANTQTGNLVLLGYNIAQGNMQKVVYYLLSISAFIAGVWLAKIIEYKFKARKNLDWLQLVVVLEIGALFVVMIIPEGHLNIFANMILSFVCAMQVQSFRKVNGKAYSTIMFTGNLKNLAERVSHYYITKEAEALENSIIYLSVIVMFVIGGWLGALTTIEYGIRAVGLINIVLAIVLILLYQEKRKL